MRLRTYAVGLVVLAGFCACTVASGPLPGRNPGTPGDHRAAVSATPAVQFEAGDPPRFSGHGNPLAAIALQSLHAARDRPLFSASRRPSPAVARPADAPVTAARSDAPPPPEPPPITLTGIITGPGLALAIFVDGSDGVIRAHTGDSLRGWTVSTVETREVTLEHAGARLTLALQSAAAVSAPPPDPSAPLRGMPVGPIVSFATASR